MQQANEMTVIIGNIETMKHAFKNIDKYSRIKDKPNASS